MQIQASEKGVERKYRTQGGSVISMTTWEKLFIHCWPSWKGEEEPVRKAEATQNVGVAKRTLGMGGAHIPFKFSLFLCCRPSQSFQILGNIGSKHNWLGWICLCVYVYVCERVCVWIREGNGSMLRLWLHEKGRRWNDQTITQVNSYSEIRSSEVGEITRK